MNNPLAALWQDQDGTRATQLDIGQMLLSLYRHKWPILALGLLAAIIAFFYASSLPPAYQASATLLIASEDATIVSIQDVYSAGYRGYAYRRTQFALLRSQSLAERVVRPLALHRELRAPMPRAAQSARRWWQPGWVGRGLPTPAGRAGDQAKASI